VKIVIDADACPKPIKDILYRAANKRQIECVLVANQTLNHPLSQYIRSVRVNKGFDVADSYIITLIEKHDLIITSGIPLADEVIKNGGVVITPNGKKYNKQNIRQALSMRNFFSDMRDAGLASTKTKPFSHQHSKAFASQLDRYLTILGV